MADGVLYRLKSEGGDMIRSPSARPTVRQLSSLLWVLGDKGMHANADDEWTAAVGRHWCDTVLHSAVSVTALSYSRVSIVLTFSIRVNAKTARLFRSCLYASQLPTLSLTITVSRCIIPLSHTHTHTHLHTHTYIHTHQLNISTTRPHPTNS